MDVALPYTNGLGAPRPHHNNLDAAFPNQGARWVRKESVRGVDINISSARLRISKSTSLFLKKGTFNTHAVHNMSMWTLGSGFVVRVIALM